MLRLVVSKVVADGLVVGGVAEVLARHEVGGDQVVVPAFAGAEHRVEDAADQFDAANHQSVDVSTLKLVGEGCALPSVEAVLNHHGGTGDGVKVQLGAPAADGAQTVRDLPPSLARR